ncbi:MAG: hypothetical protein FJY95_22920 [Candidatus Handelsmanbacteria bacterium]|nr:hypothetical protein [Candidatus Handelsmanbacteria bacterium]
MHLLKKRRLDQQLPLVDHHDGGFAGGVVIVEEFADTVDQAARSSSPASSPS